MVHVDLAGATTNALDDLIRDAICGRPLGLYARNPCSQKKIDLIREKIVNGKDSCDLKPKVPLAVDRFDFNCTIVSLRRENAPAYEHCIGSILNHSPSLLAQECVQEIVGTASPPRQERASEASGEVLGTVLGISDTPTLEATRPTSPPVIIHD